VPRGPRQIQPDHLTEITIKTFQARFLLKPNRLVNSLIIGVLAMAQKRYKIDICAVVVLCNHLHLLIVPRSEEEAMRFCQYISSNISREVGRLRRWTGGIFRRRYSDVVVTHELAAQAGRLRYLLSHGVKEKLCRRPQDWPGVHCAKALLSGVMKLEGEWIDRSAFYEARRRSERKGARRGKRPRLADHTETMVLTLSKIPAWKHLSDEAYRKAIADMIGDILGEYEDQRLAAPKIVRIAVPADYRPDKTKSSPKPVCHAASRKERKRFHQRRRDFVNTYLEASALLKEGARLALDMFPQGAFLPPVGLGPLRSPPASSA
jgi:REP element-mobilizing transposase RayT